MRPTKLTPDLLDAFRAVIADEWAALAFTEEELVWQANQKLPEEERISYRTYQRYKADILFDETQDARLKTLDAGHEKCAPELSRNDQDLLHGEADEENDTERTNAQLVQGMHETLKGALLAQKKALVRGVVEGQTNWRRYSWLLERKFPDFRLKPLTEVLAKPPHNDGGEKAERQEKREAPRPKPVPPTPEEVRKMREEWKAAQAARKASWRALPPEERWAKEYRLPWKPMIHQSIAYFQLDHMRELESLLADDIAKGYSEPWALAYRPDAHNHERGMYKCYGMGLDKLPLRAHMLRECDEPRYEEREAEWEEYDRKRRNIIRAEQGLPPEPTPNADDNMPEVRFSRRPGTIHGMSGM